MSELTFYFRRATLEDIETLRALWQTALLPIQELEKRLTEFQIVEGMDGRIFGALGAGVPSNMAGLDKFTGLFGDAPVQYNNARTLGPNSGFGPD